MASTSQQAINAGTPETTWYVYDGSGQRARKVTESAAAPGATPVMKDERVYVGAYEVYRNQNGLERETLHLMDDKQRIAMLDTEVEPRRVLGLVVGRTTPVRTMRYQMGNHLGSASLELDENAAVISYEEYHPYGTTAYQARNAGIKAAAKRYRYTGMERDEETGLEYHSARYYVVWLGRWVSADTIGIQGGGNFYAYVTNRVIISNDKTGNFEEPVHGALTYHLALAAGFIESDAAHIALATAAVDHNPKTMPTGEGLKGHISTTLPNLLSGVTSEYHFPSFETALANIEGDLSNGAKMNLNDFGTHLHSLEDVGFREAPGPHLRRTDESSPLVLDFGYNFTYDFGPGGQGTVPIIPRFEIKIPRPTAVQLLLGPIYKVFGTPDSQHQHIGSGHPFYEAQNGQSSNPLNKTADQAPSDPSANKAELIKIYDILRRAADSYYGRDVSSNDQAATSAIDLVINANTADLVNAYTNRETGFSGNSVHSYAWWVNNNKFTSIRWNSSEIDSSIQNPPNDERPQNIYFLLFHPDKFLPYFSPFQ